MVYHAFDVWLLYEGPDNHLDEYALYTGPGHVVKINSYAAIYLVATIGAVIAVVDLAGKLLELVVPMEFVLELK